MQYFLLNKKINKLNPQNITVDVFDTLLLRKGQPEFWRFYQLSKLYSNILKSYGFRTTPFSILKARQYYNSILRDTNLESGYDHETDQYTIFGYIIRDLAKRQYKSINNNLIQKICRELENITLEYEKTQLWPNLTLIKVLKRAQNNGCQIFFVSDMYLSSKQITDLLHHHSVNLLMGGISSADTYYGKSSTRVFNALEEKYSDYNYLNSIHIGDKRFVDVIKPKTIGIQTYWLVLPLHRLNQLASKVVYKFIYHAVSKRENALLNQKRKSLLHKLFSLGPMSSDKEAQYIGWVFAPAIIGYLYSLASYTEASDRQVMFITGESRIYNQLYKQLGFTGDIILPSLNRTTVMRAYAYVLYQQSIPLNEIVGVAKKLLRRKTNIFGLQTLGVISKDTNIYKLLKNGVLTSKVINSLSTKDAMQLWKKDYQTIIKTFRGITNKKVVLADIGWNDTIQILLQEILLHEGLQLDITGRYMARTGSNIFGKAIAIRAQGFMFNSLKHNKSQYLYQPEVWESFLNLDNTNNATRQNIIRGIESSIDYFLVSNNSADAYWTNHKATIVKVLKKPTKRTIELFGSMQFDYGTVDESVYSLVDTTQPAWRVYKWLILSSKRFKQFYFEQGWKWGAATYYHYRTIYRLWRRLSKKPSY